MVDGLLAQADHDNLRGKMNGGRTVCRVRIL